MSRKAALRAQLMARRVAKAPRLAPAAAEAIGDLLVGAFRLPKGAIVAAYWPLKGELDPRPGALRLAAAGHKLALPRMQGSGQPLTFHFWQPGDVLLEGGFKVMEPAPEQRAVRPTVVLAPLLGFDRQGHRLGYGKGYYDRTLRGLRQHGPILAIGLAFAFQEVDAVPVGPGDEPLDAVVTEAAVHRCSPAALAATIRGAERP